MVFQSRDADGIPGAVSSHHRSYYESVDAAIRQRLQFKVRARPEEGSTLQMGRLSRSIRKKKHRRHLGLLWLFLVALELFCPVVCDEPAFAAAKEEPVRTSVQIAYTAKPMEHVEAGSISDGQASDDQPLCTDECLCHAVSIPSLSSTTTKESSFRGERIVTLSSGDYSNSLSPPYLPPQYS